MSIEIVRGTNAKPVASAKLVDLLSTETGLDGQMFMGYPIINTPEGVHSIDAILISPSKGVILFDLVEGVEGTNAGDYETRQDDIANQIEARLKVYRGLLQRRQLRVPIHTLSFAPAGVPTVTAGRRSVSDHDQPRSDQACIGPVRLGRPSRRGLQGRSFRAREPFESPQEQNRESDDPP